MDNVPTTGPMNYGPTRDDCLKELSAACGYLRNILTDLSTGTKKATTIATCEGGLKRFEAFLDRADPATRKEQEKP